MGVSRRVWKDPKNGCPAVVSWFQTYWAKKLHAWALFGRAKALQTVNEEVRYALLSP